MNYHIHIDTISMDLKCRLLRHSIRIFTVYQSIALIAMEPILTVETGANFVRTTLSCKLYDSYGGAIYDENTAPQTGTVRTGLRYEVHSDQMIEYNECLTTSWADSTNGSSRFDNPG